MYATVGWQWRESEFLHLFTKRISFFTTLLVIVVVVYIIYLYVYKNHRRTTPPVVGGFGEGYFILSGRCLEEILEKKIK